MAKRKIKKGIKNRQLDVKKLNQLAHSASLVALVASVLMVSVWFVEQGQSTKAGLDNRQVLTQLASNDSTANSERITTTRRNDQSDSQDSGSQTNSSSDSGLFSDGSAASSSDGNVNSNTASQSQGMATSIKNRAPSSGPSSDFLLGSAVALAGFGAITYFFLRKPISV